MGSEYKFNPDDMNFNELENGFRVRFWRTFSYIFAALFVAVILNLLFLVFFDSPKERMVRNENEELKRQYAVLQERKSMVDTVFSEISEADEKIFRMIFETEPTDAGINENSVLSYAALKSLSDKQIVTFTAERLDSVMTKTRNEQLDYDILRIRSEDKADMLTYLPAIQPVENKDLTRTA